jgi:phage terminase large subunit-like protein
VSSNRAAILDRPRPRRPKGPPDRVTAYAQAVTAGRIVAGPWVRKACQKHLDELARWGTDLTAGTPYVFDLAAAMHAIGFIEQECVLPDVRDVDGVPVPFTLQPWQCFIVGSVFGWRGSDGARRFRTAYIECGKGAGKTSLAAAIGLYCLTADGELFAEVYSVAVSQKQARLIFQDACRMREFAPRLKDYVLQTAHTLQTEDGGKFEARSSEHRALEGLRPSCSLIDEVHEHPDDQVITRMRRGGKGRRAPLTVEITNSGWDKTSVCWRHHEHSTRVLDGAIDDPSWFGYVCALDEADNYCDPVCWPKSNPNLHVSIQPRYLEEAVREAQTIPAAEPDVLRLNFCRWTDAKSAYIPAAQWMANHVPKSEEELRPFPCVAALDLGESDDMSALAVVWRLGEDQYHCKAWIWTCEAAMQKYRTRPYSVWQRAGALTVTSGNVTDYPVIRRDVAAIARRLGVQKIAFDRRGALQLSQELTGDGLTMVDQAQGFFLSEPTKTLSRLVASGNMTHDGHPVLTWMMGNLAVLHGTRGDIRPVKTFGADKVDGAVALIMALNHAVMPAPPPKPAGHVYDRKDILILGGDD